MSWSNIMFYGKIVNVMAVGKLLQDLELNSDIYKVGSKTFVVRKTKNLTDDTITIR